MAHFNHGEEIFEPYLNTVNGGPLNTIQVHSLPSTGLLQDSVVLSSSQEPVPASSSVIDIPEFPVHSVLMPAQPDSHVVMSAAHTGYTNNVPLGEQERHLRQQISRLLQQSATSQVTREQLRTPHSHSHTHSHLPHSHNIPVNPQVPMAQPISPPGAPPDMAINLGDMGGLAPPQQVPGHDANAQPAEPTSGAAGRTRRVRRQIGDQIQGIPGLGPLLRNLEGAVPFLLLIFAKVMYNHRLGLLVFIAMFGTFYYANSSLRKMIALRDSQTWSDALSGYVWIIGFLAANILFIYFVFADQNLYKCLYFQSPDVGELDLWNLMWLTIITDFVIKFSTIAVKSMIAILPKHILLFKRKGKYFLFLERVSQCYRSLVPIPHWCSFLLDHTHGGQWVACTLFIVYCIFKGLHIKTKATELKQASVHVRVDVSFGTSASREEIKAFDNTCPICQDLFTEPIKLSCKHVFCDDCICLWLDREKTCPMCRAHITDNPIWRDGATSGNVQFY